MNRIYAYPDGTIGATWQCSGEGAVPDRGTGYNYYDGAEWGTADPHIGADVRTGWPSYAPWGPNGEILCHYWYATGSLPGPIKFYKRENKGEGDWVETVLYGPEGLSIVWHSMTTSGENHEHIHLLAFTYDAPYQGQEHALVYYRSSDGAVTWDIDGVIIEGLGADYFATINLLNYDWANPVGNTIAFSYGFDEFGGRVFKSYDNGDSWDIIEVFESPFDPTDPPTDTEMFPCGVGTSACALDSEEKLHVVFSRMRKIWTSGDLYYYPYTDGLIYWNEDMPVLDTTIISSYTLDYLNAAGNLIGWVMSSEPYEIPDEQPNYGSSLCAFPQISIDADDNMFVAYSTLAPDYSSGTFFYRHILANGSFDGGNIWNGQIDLNAEIQFILSECAYPEMAPVIGDYVHVVFQEDNIPGIHEWLENHPPCENRMYHKDVPKDIFIGVCEPAETLQFEISQNFPNPASNTTQLGLRLEKTSDVSVSIVNVVGQIIKKTDMGTMNTGNNIITLDVSDLSPGIYYYTVQVDEQKATRKMIVQ
jgi:hypothetical protein